MSSYKVKTMRTIKKSVATSEVGSPKVSKESKMHRRSRTGCYTCRLRRKKCDENTPICRACKHLGVDCEYKKPAWWLDPVCRRNHKEDIKEIIKQTKLAERPVRVPTLTPPGMSYSIATKSTISDSLAPPTRGASESSYCSPPPHSDFEVPGDFSTPRMLPPQWSPIRGEFPRFPPFELDVKTERQVFVNDKPTRKDSAMSHFSVFQPLSPQDMLHSMVSEPWIQQEYHENYMECFNEEPLEFHFFNHTHEPSIVAQPAQIKVDECDQHLLDHFLENTAPFPILDVSQPGFARSDIIFPALATNKCYLHCCLSTAAVHLKATKHLDGEQADADIMRHRSATISELCEAFQADTNHARIIEAALGLIYFQSSVGTVDDDLPDIPWHQHFQAVTSLLQELEVQNSFQGDTDLLPQSHFNMTLASWIDILGATMLQSRPVFCETYRNNLEQNLSSGLSALMGCDDRVMYLISEIACLDNIRASADMDDLTLCDHITNLGEQLNLTETCPFEIGNVYAASTGAIRPKQLSNNITAIFRLAARIHLCSLVPEFDSNQPNIVALVDSIAEAMDFVPGGPRGFDRSLIWPLLIGGSTAGPESPFRSMLAERLKVIGDSADFGSFGRLKELLKDIWSINDEAAQTGQERVHWRDVMGQKGWDFLLI